MSTEDAVPVKFRRILRNCEGPHCDHLKRPNETYKSVLRHARKIRVETDKIAGTGIFDVLEELQQDEIISLVWGSVATVAASHLERG